MDKILGISDNGALTAILAIAEKAQSEGSFAASRFARDDIVFIALQDGGKDRKEEGKS